MSYLHVLPSVAYARWCQERDEWTEALEAYRTSTGRAHIVARRIAQPLVHRERMRLRRERAEFMKFVKSREKANER